MIVKHTPRRIILFVVDCLVFLLALYGALSLRFQELYSVENFLSYLPSFSFVILVSLGIFYMYGLYDKPTLRLVRELSARILTAQILTAGMAVILFYAIPTLGIAPKTILLLYLLLSVLLSTVWRHYAFSLLLKYKKQKSIIIGSGQSFHALVEELTRNPHIGITLVATIDVNTYPLHTLEKTIREVRPDSIIIDMRDERVKPYFGELYTQLFNGALMLDILDVYEDVFDMVPLDLINQEWVFRHMLVSQQSEVLKRLLDLILAVPAGAVSLLVYPFVYIAIKLEDGGPLFYKQARIGKHGVSFVNYKFRTMENKPTYELQETKKIGYVGTFLRKTRIDELPQLWNVIRGDVSLIGPRPETPALVDEYTSQIPFYPVRHLVRPGLSGWAQTQQTVVPKFGVQVDLTAIKLAYDVYYIKHANLLLDISIIIRTVKVLLSKSGV